MIDPPNDSLTPESGVLYVISTPIGNMGDLSPRASALLRAVDLVLCEDTRHSRPLLNRIESRAAVDSLHEHNEARQADGVVERLVGGASVALISDAGTPLLSDPGERLVAAAIAAGVTVRPVPGPSAMLAGLVVSGFATDAFTFLGFLPRKGKARTVRLNLLSDLPHCSVLYEAANRTAETLSDLESAGCGGRGAVVARELTKKFEEVRRGTVAELARYYENAPPRGEVVIVLNGRSEVAPEADEAALAASVAELRQQGLSARDIMRALMEDFGASRNIAYRLAHQA